MSRHIAALLQESLADPKAGWSIGTFGAIAEFHQDAGEQLRVDDAENFARATDRGAIRIERSMIDSLVPIAYETVSPKKHRWAQAISLCVAYDAGLREQRTVLTNLGEDVGAIRPQDRTAILFDLGLGLPQIDFCVRTADPELIELLTSCEGRSVFDQENPAMGEILRRHPHRIAVSNIGRAEVFQKIGGPDTGGVSPPGPHTHLLPKLLRTGRTHSANTPIPAGLIPCGSLHPENPVIGVMGEDIPFSEAAFNEFQELLAAFGCSEYVETKERVRAGIEARAHPNSFIEPRTRLGRAALKNMLRQLGRLADHRGDQALLDTVDLWRSRFDSVTEDDEDDAPGH